MAWRKQRNVDTSIETPTGFPTMRFVIATIKKLITASQYDFYETEAFDVEEVILNDQANPGGIRGTFANDKKQKVKGGIVLPLKPNITQVPLVGEQVVVMEYNGQHYYTDIINKRRSVVHNAIGKDGKKIGDTFQIDNSVKKIKLREGDLLFEGRFGNSINLTSDNNNNPLIKIRAGQRTDYNQVNSVIEEEINKDKSSIYLSTGENIRVKGVGKLGDENVSGNSIVINSDKLLFNSRDGDVKVRASKDVVIEGEEVFINAKKAGTIKMGDPKGVFIPTVNGEKLFELFISLTKILTALPSLPTANPQAIKNLTFETKNVVGSIQSRDFLNTSVMVSDPNFKVPDVPKFPDLPDLELEKLKAQQGIKPPKVPKAVDIKDKLNNV
tara:strand:- start:56 stop:1207 length:1152 start_codon:yes stop_codon:yes gene_type:complete